LYLFNNLGRDVGQIANLPYIPQVIEMILSLYHLNKEGEVGVCAVPAHTPTPNY